ncbi:hypothetical protein TNCV_3023061 [Trichonephila clavipes]|nr:hypothetical protein TNCV_3023061 [Trichonephila clavipes]
MNEFAVKDVRVNKNTVVDWYMFCREVCMAAVLKESEPLGGEGKIVEIDESMFGKMKYERGSLRMVNRCLEELKGSRLNVFRVVPNRTKRGTFECYKGVGGTRVRYNFGLLEGLCLPFRMKVISICGSTTV